MGTHIFTLSCPTTWVWFHSMHTRVHVWVLWLQCLCYNSLSLRCVPNFGTLASLPGSPRTQMKNRKKHKNIPGHHLIFHTASNWRLGGGAWNEAGGLGMRLGRSLSRNWELESDCRGYNYCLHVTSDSCLVPRPSPTSVKRDEFWVPELCSGIWVL